MLSFLLPHGGTPTREVILVFLSQRVTPLSLGDWGTWTLGMFDPAPLSLGSDSSLSCFLIDCWLKAGSLGLAMCMLQYWGSFLSTLQASFAKVH